jgi:alanyl-tRNA synthetase
MDSAEIRRRFLQFFADRGHAVVPSASLLLDDPTLLFVNAGMVPFKPYFLGEAVPPYATATSVQKCVRTLDIEEVGKTTRHASFFQMAGNFSFGDYFKAEAIPYAWDLLTKPTHEGGYAFPESKLWVTVYEDDDEGADIWHRVVGVPKERIQRRGLADNFWHMGVPGPGGPCSEIYFDRGAEYGQEGGPVVDEDRYLEVWNLVFMQHELSSVRTKIDFDIAGDLPARNIDTGMGLERMAALLQGVENIYEIDTTKMILDRATELSGARYGVNASSDVALRVIADHARTCTFLVGDGVLPGNEGRGYVLRRLMRRVIRNMRILGADLSMGELVEASVDAMGPQYPELSDARGRIRSICEGEEAAFLQTLRTGTLIFEGAARESKSTGSSRLSGEQAFSLHDTYGFPIDLTMEMAAEQGLEVDRDGFTRLMTEQRERAKADARTRKSGLTNTTAYRQVMENAGTTEFTGYEQTSTESRVTGLLRDGVNVEHAQPGDHVEIVLARTPFYAEGGGQLGDHGRIRLSDGGLLDVYDVQSPVPGLFVHRAHVVEGEVRVGTDALGDVDVERRNAISRAHTATHMVHKAFRESLGDTATQMGSENAPGRLRFDFPSPTAVSDDVLAGVEERVNTLLLEDLEVSAQVVTQDEARAMGAMALFGEKYGEHVRVVSVGDWARELCGGTHTRRSGQLGVVKFLSEGSIGAGVRRVEALVGADAYRYLAKEHLLLSSISTIMKSRPDEVIDRIEATLIRLRDAERELARIRSAELRGNVEAIIGSPTHVSAGQVWAFKAPESTTPAELRDLVLEARGRIDAGSSAGVIGLAVFDGKVSVVAAVNEVGQKSGLSADALLKLALPHVGGRGGGKADMAQGGGTEVAGVAAALAAVLAGLT